MPQQSARPPVGHQSGRGARLNPIRRLTLAGVGLIIGGALIAVGSRLTWAQVTPSGRTVFVPGLPRVSLSGGQLTYDASGVGSGWVFGVGLLIALVSLAWLVLAWRGRLAAGLLAFAAAALVVYHAAADRSDFIATARLRSQSRIIAAERLRISTGPGIPVTSAGGAVAAIAAISGTSVGKSAPRLRLPERPPGDPQGNGHR